MKSSSYNRILSTLNVILIFAGYQFFSGMVSMFLGDAESLLVNVGYRGFYAIVCFLVIINNFNSKHPKNNNIVRVLFFFWLLVMIRFISDLYLNPSVSVSYAIRNRTLLYMVVLTLMPMVSVVLSIRNIDFDLAFKWITILISVAILVVFFQNFNYQSEEIEDMTRTSSEGLSSIGTGQLGLTAIVVSICYFFRGTQKKNSYKIAMIVVSILGVVVMLRSGSRGPLLALIGVGSVFGISKAKRPLIWLPVLLLFVVFYNQIFDFLLNIISYIAPNLSSRITHKSEIGGQFDNRMFYFMSAIGAFRESPFIGKQFAIYLPGDEMIYTHNIFLDSIMQLGIIGGLLMLTIIIGTLKLVYQLIRQGKNVLWICLLFIQQLFFLMVSSSFYYTPLFSICIVLLYQWDSVRIRKQPFLDLKKKIK